MATSTYQSPDLPRISEIVIGWLLDPSHQPLAPQVADWDVDVWETARWAVQIHGIAPLLDRAAATWPDADVLHPHLRDYLAAQRQRSAARVTLLMEDLAEILAALAVAGVQALPLKGSLLSTLYYPEAGLRPMNDLDLLVRPADEARAIVALERCGYQMIARSWKHAQLGKPAAQGPTVAFDGEHPDNPRSIDLHTRLGEQFWGIRYELTEDAWAHSEPAALLDQPALVMRPAMLLHHLVIHATCDAIARRLRLLHLNDIALVAAQVDQAGWEQLVRRAQACGEERFAYPTLALLARYYAVVPPTVLAALRPGVPAALLAHLAGSALDRLSYCNSAPTTLSEKLCWYRPGRERAVALRHIILPDPNEIASWYPQLARRPLLPLAYARYGAQMIGWGMRRALGKPRMKLAAGVRGDGETRKTGEGVKR